MFYRCDNSDSASLLPLKILYVNDHFLQEPIHRPAGNDYYQWFFCVKGSGTLEIKGQRQLITPGMGFLIVPGEAYSYSGLTQEWIVHIFSFSGSLCPDLLQSLHMHVSGAYEFSDVEIFEKHIQHIISINSENRGERSRLYSAAAYDFLLHISQSTTRILEHTVQTENPLITQIISYLEDNYSQCISLDDLAKHVYLSKEYLCAQFKLLMGETIMDYLMRVRIGRSKFMLIHYPEYTAAQVGKKCGFQSPSYFGKIFKQETGMTPNMYRKRAGQ